MQTNYTKVSDKLVAKFGIKVAYIYAKLRYRMNLSNKNHHFKDHHGHFIVYKVNDLARDCHMGRNSVMNALKKLDKAGYIHKFRTMFANRIYLPKFNNELSKSSKRTKQSLKTKLPKEQRNNNKNYNNSYSSSVLNVKKRVFPSIQTEIKNYGLGLVRYAIKTYYRMNKLQHDMGHRINNPEHFIAGVLRRWGHKHIKTVNDAMKSEKDPNADYGCANGMDIPIFRL